MDGWSFEEILVVLLFITAAYIAIRRMRHPWMCSIFVGSLPTDPKGCGNKAVGSVKDARGAVHFFCRNHDPRVEWMQARLEARGIHVVPESILLFGGSLFPPSSDT
ncbi:MAG: hypothetical protein WAP51_01820 [Candidatus Sungiibacteriota bacterium]